jgi:hydrogenase-4 component B
MSPLLAAAVVLALGAALAVLLPGNRARAWAALAAQALAALLVESAVVPVLFGAPDLRATTAFPIPVGEVVVHVDALSAFFLAWSLPLTLLGSIYALGYLSRYFGSERHVGLHFALLTLTALSFLLIYTLENGLLFFFGWELAALSAWLLVIWDYPSQKVRFAGFNYLVSTHLSLLLLVGAFMLLHGRTGSFGFDAFAAALRAPGPTRGLVFVLLLGSFALKSAFYPFHTWLPRAHAAAPAHVSALMSGVIHKAGLFGLLKLSLLLGRPEAWMGWTVVAVSATSAVVGALHTITQRDLKRLLGYSSTENVGICGLGIGVGLLGLAWDLPAVAALGFAGGTLHVLNHALFKCLLFYGAGAVHHATHTVDLERLGGLVKVMPRTTLLVLLGAVALAGLPPLNGFVSEWVIYAGLLSAGPAREARTLLALAAGALALVGALSALAMARAFGVAFLGAPRDPSARAHAEAPAPLLVAMAACALAMGALGLWPAAGLALVRAPTALQLASSGATPEAVAVALARPAGVVAPLALLALSLVGAALALLALRRLLERGSPVHVTWGCGYGAGTPRMQYTGASFSDALRRPLVAVLPLEQRADLPARDDPFPPRAYHLHTHSVDAVERRMFEVLGRGQVTADRLNEALPDEPRASFALGLAFLVIGAAIAVWSAS